MTTALPGTPSTRISLSPMGPTSVPISEQNGSPEVTTDEGKVSSSDLGSSHRASLSQELQASSCVGTVDPRFVLPKCELPARNELEPVELFVANAVREQHQQQDSQILKNYRGILEAFRFKKDLVMLRKLMIALRTSGSTLSLLTSDSTKHARLIHQVVRFLPFSPNTATNAKIIRRPDDHDEGEAEAEKPLANACDVSVADAQFHLILALISANSVFLVPAMTALWKMLTFQISDSHPERSRRIHAALATIMRLCPKAKTELLPIISSNAPFRMRPEAELIWYYKQCLHVLEYLAPIRGQILELIIDRCLEIDVEIKITDIGEATIDTEDSDGADIFQLDLDDDENKKPETPKDVTVDEMADKLDSLMLMLFEHSEQSLQAGISAGELYQVLSRVFDSAILVTHKSKFVQFLILHLCGMETKAIAANNNAVSDSGLPVEEAVLYREFASNLIDVILDPYRASVTRQSGACYLASFVSRASFVCVETACESVHALLRWAEAYIQSLGPLSVHAPDARDQCSMHQLFYTVCQSAFYIMCFRGAEAVRYGSPEEKSEALLAHIDLGAARWTKICTHPLLPLRYCLESVRSEFLRISKLFSLIDDDALDRLVTDELRTNGAGRQRKKKGVVLITTAVTLEKERLRGGVGGLGRGTNPLDSFFPYDPLLLRRSSAFVEPFYKHWDGGAPENEINDDDNYDEEDTANVVGGSEDEAGSQTNSVGGDSDSDSDDETELEPTYARKRLMSFASNATSVSSRPGSLEDRGVSADVVAKRGELKKAWTKTVKRPRAPSSENGSW